MKAFDPLRVSCESLLIKRSEDDNGTKAVALTFSKKLVARELFSMVPVRERMHLQFTRV